MRLRASPVWSYEEPLGVQISHFGSIDINCTFGIPKQMICSVRESERRNTATWTPPTFSIYYITRIWRHLAILPLANILSARMDVGYYRNSIALATTLDSSYSSNLCMACNLERKCCCHWRWTRLPNKLGRAFSRVVNIRDTLSASARARACLAGGSRNVLRFGYRTRKRHDVDSITHIQK